MIGFGTGPWTPAILGDGSGAATAESATYGRSINVNLGSQGLTFGTLYGPNVGADGFTDNINKRWRRSVWPIWMNNADEGGETISLTVSVSGASAASQATRAIDDLSDDFDLMANGAGLRNANGTFLTLSPVPFAKYDVFVLLGHRSDSPASFSCSLRDGESRRRWYVSGSNNARWSGAWIPPSEAARLSSWPSGSANVLLFPACSSSSWTLDVLGASTSGYFSIIGFSIVERLDSLEGATGNDATIPAWQFYFNGDSYIDGGDLAKRVQRQLLLQENLLKNSFIEEGLGGDTWAGISARTRNANLTDTFMILWDGDDNGSLGVATTLSELADQVTYKGDDQWIYIPSIPNLNDSSAAKVARYEGYRDGAIAAHGAAHVFDPFPALQALDPGDTSVGGLPAAAFVDAFHLTDAAKEAVAVALIPKVAALL